MILDDASVPSSASASATVDDSDDAGLRSGDHIGRYRLVQRLGSGGMGVVWVAHDPRLDRTVAVKLLHERRRRGSSMARERLRREALALARLSHPNVVSIYDVGIHEDRVFLAMEHVEGRTLDQWVVRGPDRGQVLDVFIQAAAGLAAVHSAGFVHRDFKPANVMIDREGRVLVMDFGLARIHDPDSVSEHDGSQSSASGTFVDAPTTASWTSETPGAFSTVLTGDGVIMGTPAYMAPEQHVGDEADARADQFSFCVTLFEMLLQRRPYRGRTVKELAQDKHRNRLDFSDGPFRVSLGLRRLLRRGLANEPARRFHDMHALREALVAQRRPVVRTRTAAAVCIGALTLGAAGWAGLGGHGSSPCDGGATQAAEVWNADVRADLHRSFDATGLSYATDAARRTSARLDDYADEWTQAFQQACAVVADDEAATAVLDLRMDCLDEARDSMAAAVDLMVEADPITVQRAVGQVAGLPALSRCDDDEALRVELPMPDDPEAQRAIEGIRRQLEQARALDQAGRYAQARREANAALEQALALEHEPSVARARIRRASSDHGLGEVRAARRGLVEAALLASGVGDHPAAADAATRLVFVCSEELGNPAEALRWARHAEASLARMPDDPLARARLEGNLGIVESARGNYQRALEHFERSYQQKREILGDQHPEVATALENLGLSYGELGRTPEAERIHRQSLASMEALLGPRHPDYAHSLMNLGHTVDLLGRHDEAAELFTRALGVLREALGARHPMVARTLSALGHVASAQDRLTDAEAYYRQAAEIIETTYGERHHEHAWLISDLAMVTAQLGRDAEALELYARAREVLEMVHGPDHDAIAHVLMSEASSLIQLSRTEEAERFVDRAGAIIKARLEVGHPTYARYHAIKGDLAREKGELDEARDELTAALQIASGTEGLGADHPETASILLSLGPVEHERGEHVQAAKHLRRALAITEAAAVGEAFRAAIRFELAKALWPDPAFRTEARDLASTAHRGFAEYGTTFDEDLADIDAWRRSHRVR